jgi:nucleotidyltransferase/DNA polymerase involved in DNA repair
VTSGEVVQQLRDKIFERTGLTASAGIAPNTFLAKVD